MPKFETFSSFTKRPVVPMSPDNNRGLTVHCSIVYSTFSRFHVLFGYFIGDLYIEVLAFRAFHIVSSPLAFI